MPALQFGLNVRNKAHAKPAPAVQNGSAFDAADSDEDDVEATTTAAQKAGQGSTIKKAQAGNLSGAKSKAAKGSFFDDPDSDNENSTTENTTSKQSSYGIQDSQPKKPSTSKPPLQQGTDLSTLRTQRRVQAEAEAVDPSIYDYDASYDALHAADAAKKAAARADAAERRPRYMDSLLAAAEVRKKDQLRAKDKAVQKEREAEGEEFADKEKFVTGAYREQQEEVRRAEEEEQKREEEQEKKRKGKGMVGFYKAEMDRREKEHAEAMQAVGEVAKTEDGVPPTDNANNEEQPQERRDAELARELNSKGAEIALDDEGHVIDKRQLLSAGLNVAPKPKTTSGLSSSSSNVAQKPGARPNFYAENRSQREDRRQRETERMMKQLEAGEKRKADEEEAERKEREEKAKSRKTGDEVMGARERYLARKREAEAVKAKES